MDSILSYRSLLQIRKLHNTAFHYRRTLAAGPDVVGAPSLLFHYPGLDRPVADRGYLALSNQLGDPMDSSGNRFTESGS